MKTVTSLVVSAVLGAGLLGVSDVHAAMISFRQGEDNGFGVYNQAADTWLDETAANADTNFGTDVNLRVDFIPDIRQSLLRYDGIFGNNPGQIPLGSTINAATLTIYVNNAGNSRFPTRMLEAWDANTITWNNALLGSNIQAGIQADGIEAVAPSGPGFLGSPANAYFDIDVQSLVQDWSNSQPNYGMVFLQNTDNALNFTSSDGDLAERPLLTVDFTPIPEPGTLAFLVPIALAARRRSQR